jgi:integrase
MATIKTKTNGVYYLEVRLPDPDTGNLKRSRVSLETRDMGEAKRQRADWLSGRHPKHPAMGGVIAAKGRGPLRETATSRNNGLKGMTLCRWIEHCEGTLWANCKSKATTSSNIRILTDVIPDDLLLADVAAIHITQALRALRERRAYADGSLKKLMGALSSALAHATDELDEETGLAYLMVRPKFPKIDTPRNIKDRVLSEEEEVAMMACIAARAEKEPKRPWRHFGWYLTVLLDTGFRMSEGLGLGPASVVKKRWLAPVTGEAITAVYLALPRYSTKNDNPREVPASDRVLELIPKLNLLAANGRWFPWGPKSGGPGYFILNLRADMAAKGFDLSDVTLHTLRHTCATRLCLGGIDLVTLRDWLGHSDIQITAKRYIHRMTAHLHIGAAILNMTNGAIGATGGSGEQESTPSTMVDCLPNGRDRAEPVTHLLQ